MKLIDRKVFISMLFLVFSMLGYVSYQRLDMELTPNAEFPMLFISVSSQQEVDPSYMETQAIIPLEGVVGQLEGVESITSDASNTRGTVMIEFAPDVDIKYTYLKLEEKVKGLKSSIPDEFTTMVNKFDMNSMSNQFMELQVLGGGGIDRVRTLAEQEIVTELENIDGVANVKIYGGREKSIEVILNPDACKAYGVTPGIVRRAISDNYKSRSFAGHAKGKSEQLFVHVTSEYTSVSQIENLVINKNNILLKDVAEVYFGVKEETSYSRVNGKDAVSLILTNESTANMIDLSHRTREVIAQLNDKLGNKDISIDVEKDTAEEMETNIDQIMELALIGALLAILVLWIFLRKLRLISVIALAIPISVLTAYNFFYAYDISINTLTLVGLALAVGMLLDNAVVVLENIYRLRAKGLPIRESVLQGTHEVWRSVFAATLTTVAVFLPFVFAEEFMIKLMGRQIGVSIISTLLVSLAVALLLIPMTVNAFMKHKSEGQSFYRKLTTDNTLVQGYVILLKSSMRTPLRTIVSAVVVFFVSTGIMFAVSLGGMKEVETDNFKIYVTMNSGSTLETTDETVADIEEELGKFGYIENVTSRIEEEEAILTVNLFETFEDSIEGNIGTVKEKVRKKLNKIKNAEIGVDEEPTSSASYGGGRGAGGGGQRGGNDRMMRMMGVGSNQESIVIRGGDFEEMRNVADDLEYFLSEMDNISRSSVNVPSDQPEMQMNFNPLLLEEYGITQNEIMSELNSFSNEINTRIPFKQGLDEYDIIISEQPEEGEVELEARSLDDLKAVELTSTEGTIVELQNVSRFVYSSGMRRIMRVNQEKEIQVTYSFTSEAQDSESVLEAYRAEVDELVNSYPLPSGVAVQVVHEEDDMQDFTFLIFAALLLIYMILASVFESLSTPLVLMFTIPLAAIGSFLALAISGNSIMNMNSLMGLLILLGIVVNNGIILIDYSNILMARGYRRTRALIYAGLSRVRPILITVITTIVAMAPLALGDEEYVGAIGAPFAITVIGGLVVSTVLTLIFIPTFYFGLENALAWIRGLKWYIKTIQTVLLTTAFALIYFYVESALWQAIDVVATLLVIPGVTWFIMNSLRQANENVIDPNQPIVIRLQNLVKIYDRPSRFMREWNGNKHLRTMRGVAKRYLSFNDFQDYIWQVPLLGFLLWFTFAYLESGIWQFIMAVATYFYLLQLWKPVMSWSEEIAKPKPARFVNKCIIFVYPIITLALFHIQWENPGGEFALMLLWYLALAIHFTSEKLHRDKVNVERLTGRFAKLRRLFYLFVCAIPVIGKKKTPFKALQGVSLEISTGMFGLLGPNGAGKSTMMRIICGIYEQSYGKVWINGIDTQEKREELQGLIGYLPQEFGTYENMSAIQFLDYQAILKGLHNAEERKERLEYVLNAVHLWDRRDEDIGGFSGGMKQRIGIALILLHLPRILVVDEPTAGLDPRERIRFRNLLVELSKERIVIFSTHVIEDIASSCNQVAVVNRGQLRYHGHPNQMIHIAEGKVWRFRVSAQEFDTMPNKDKVVHHAKDGNEVVVRFLSETQPTPDAIQVAPVLEEAYLCLLKGMNGKSKDVNREVIVES